MTGPAPCHALRMIASTPSPMRTGKAGAMTKPEPITEWPTVGQQEPPAPTDRDNQGRFLTGNSGGGRPKGARNKLSETFLETIAKHFADHGAEAVKRVREGDPATYLKLIAWLIPRELIMQREQGHDADLADLTDEQAAARIEAEHRRKAIRYAIGMPNGR